MDDVGLSPEVITEFITPITSQGAERRSSTDVNANVAAAQLIDKFRHRIDQAVLKDEEKSFFRAVSSALVQRASDEQRWTVEDITRFLKVVLPPHLQRLAPRASPIIYRLMECLGSYPYHLSSNVGLTGSIARSAIAQLTRRDDYYLRFWGGEGTYEEHNDGLDRRFRRIVFQCLMDGAVSGQNDPRTNAQDEDLMDVLGILELPKNLRHPDNIGQIIARRPPLPDPKTLPSSCSADLSGSVKLDEWRILLTILQGVNRSGPAEDGVPVDQPDPTNECYDALTWADFERATSRVAPLLDSFEPLLGVFFGGPIDLIQLRNQAQGDDREDE